MRVMHVLHIRVELQFCSVRCGFCCCGAAYKCTGSLDTGRVMQPAMHLDGDIPICRVVMQTSLENFRSEKFGHFLGLDGPYLRFLGPLLASSVSGLPPWTCGDPVSTRAGQVSAREHAQKPACPNKGHLDPTIGEEYRNTHKLCRVVGVTRMIEPKMSRKIAKDRIIQ